MCVRIHIFHIAQPLADWFGVLTPELVDGVLDHAHDLMDEIRPDAVALVDAFGYDDEQLSSTLGRYDGKVYEAIYEQARASPLNRSQKMVGWESLSKVLDLDFIKAGVGQRAGVAPSKL